MPATTTSGTRLIPHVIDDLARSDADQVWNGVPKDDSDLAQGYKYYTYGNLANAINTLAHEFESKLGGKSNSFDTITYIGPNDARYLVVVVAAIKTGYKALLVSPRNSFDAQINLLGKTDCHAIVHPASHTDMVAPWLEKRPMKSVVIPELEDLMHAQSAPEYPYTRTFEEGRFDPFVLVHTSGSTGFPKAIVVRAGMMAIMDAYRDLPDFDGRPNWVKFMSNDCKSLFLPMPLFHSAGLYTSFAMAVYYKRPILFPPPSKPVNGSVIEECLRTSGADASFIAPSILEEFSANEDSVKLLASLKYVATGSANISTSIGDYLTQNGVQLHNLLASTENTPYPMFKQDPKDWAYFCIQDEPNGFEWRPAGDDIYELFAVRKQEDPGLQACFYTFPDLQEWSTRDLYKKHPTRPNCWLYYGRADNVIVFSNGEKLNPVSLEDAINAHPKVKGALVVGKNHFQPALLLEPYEYPESADGVEAFIDEIWPVVAKANESTVAHGRIQRPFIGVTTKGKDFPRAGKGTIQRVQAADLYNDEIEKLYADVETAEVKSDVKLDVSSKDALTASLLQMINGQLSQGTLEDETDFFSAGMDSMQALTISRGLKSSLKQAAGDEFDPAMVNPGALYRNPTARGLASAIFAQLHKSGTNGTTNDDHANGDDVDAIKAMVEKYTKDLPAAKTLSEPSAPATSDITVLLTGSTGSLGSYILDILNNHPSVKKIITLNRSEDPAARQTSSSSSRGLPTAFPKTIFLTADLSQPQLGLSAKDYNTVLQESDVVLHNQWRVNFNLSLASFEPQIKGTRRLIDLSAASPKRPRIVFVTTIAEATGYVPTDGSIPEASLPDYTMPAELGYGAGKLAASRILEAASTISGVPMAVVRVGQVAGPVDRRQGSWNRWEWFPSIVASSVHLGALPRTLGAAVGDNAVAWVPVEREAQLLVDVTLAAGDVTGYLNGVNPRSASYPDVLVPVLRERLGGRVKEVVEWAEWVARLTASEPATRTPEQVERNPGVKLLDFYQALESNIESDVSGMQWRTERSQKVSATWRELEPVKTEWLVRWIEQWGF